MNAKRKGLMLLILGLMLAALASVIGYYWYHNTYYVETEDAKITGDLVNVSPQTTGKLLEFAVEEGDTLVKGQILGRQQVSELSDANIEQSLIRAPINGVVIKKSGMVGQIATTGSTLAVMVDFDALYITANIEETKLGRVQIGQTVDITVDQFTGKHFTGTVKSVGLASNATFSLLPSSSGSTFTKVVQKIPVKIQMENSQDVQLLPGTNAVVKIHVK